MGKSGDREGVCVKNRFSVQFSSVPIYAFGKTNGSEDLILGLLRKGFKKRIFNLPPRIAYDRVRGCAQRS